MAASSLTVPAPPDRGIETRVRRWFAARRDDAMVVLVLGAAIGALHSVGLVPLFYGDAMSGGGMAVIVVGHVLVNLMYGVVLASVALWLERQRLTGWRHGAAVVVAVLAVSAATGTFTALAPWLVPPLLEHGIGFSAFAMGVASFCSRLLEGTLVFAYFIRRRAQDESAQRLAAVQADQRAAARRVAEARLKSLTARVDPQLLFGLLDSVQRAYHVDPPRAERLLDELIVFLRTALARLHRSSSTVGQECELAASYARLLNLAGTSRAALDAAVGSAGSARCPPGVILPIVEDLLSDGGSAPVSISAALGARHCELQIACGRAPGALALQRARDMLELHDDGSAIEVLSGAGGVVITLKVVHEHP